MEIYNDNQKQQLKQHSEENLLSPRSNANWGIKKVISTGIGLILAGLILPFVIHMAKALSVILVIEMILENVQNRRSRIQ